MKISRFWLFIILICSAYSSQAQSSIQFNGQFNIQQITDNGGGQFQIRGAFTDQSSVFQASDALPGDRIIDGSGRMFEVTSLTSDGSIISALAIQLNAIPPTLGEGMIYRPSPKGFPLVANNVSTSLIISAQNTAILSIDNNIPNYASGTELPVSTAKIGDVVVLTGNSKLYKLDKDGWKAITDIPFVFGLPGDGNKGDVVYNALDDKNYTYDGNSWVSPKALSALPSQSKYGDVFFDTSQNKLFMCDMTGKWLNISSASIPGGSQAELPANSKPGDMFFNTDLNTLYVFDTNNKWVEVSTNGSTPAGTVNPDPVSAGIKEGSLFYNTADHKLYVNNGTAWLPLDNTLRNGQIFVGNAANIATSVALTGDATISNIGKLALKDLAVTNEKLDKANIPLSGFGNPLDNVSMGDGITNFKITNLANPSGVSDAATKGYVDAILAAPGGIVLANNNMFVGNLQNKAIATAKTAIPISGFGIAAANVSMGTGTAPLNFKITNMADPSAAQDAATKNYVDTRVIIPGNLTLPKGNMFVGSDIGTAAAVAKSTILLNEFGAPAADVSIGNFKLTNLANPVAAQDAATKNYIDTKIINPANITLTTGNLFIGDVTGKASDVLKNTIPLSGFAPAAADVSIGGFVLTNLADPLADGDASTKKYVDDLFKTPSALLALPVGNFFMGNATGKAEAIQKKLIPVSGFAKATDNIYMGDAATQYNISFLADPLFAQDAATKNYVDNKLSAPAPLSLATDHLLVGDASGTAAAVAKNAIPLSDLGAAKADLSIGDGTANFKITNLADPTNDQEAATKKYVDSKIATTPASPTAPATGLAGDTYYNTGDNRLYVYNGTKWVPLDNKLADGNLYVGNTEGVAVSTPKNIIPISGFGSAQGDISLGNFKITNLVDPTNDQEAATKKYVDSKTATTPAGPTAPATAKAGDIYYNTTENRLYFYNGTTWNPIDAKLSNGELFLGDANGIATSTAKNTIPLSGFDNAKADISLGDGTANFKITNLADPANDQEAATKKYVDDGLVLATAGGKDNLGNHEATQNIKLSVNSISNDGATGKGVTFEAAGNAVFGQDLTINGNFFTPSDRRLKTNIETLSTVLQKIDQIRGVRFEYKDQHKYAAGPKIGVIAQELQKVYPEMVIQGKDGFLKVDYTQLTGILIQAVKEQQQEIDGLKSALKQQQQQIDSILKKMQ